MHRRDADFLTRGACLFEIALFLTVRSGIVCSKSTISRFYQTTMIVSIAPLWFLPTTVSISKSPNRFLSSTSGGRKSMLIVSRIRPHEPLAAPRLRYLRPLWCKCR